MNTSLVSLWMHQFEWCPTNMFFSTFNQTFKYWQVVFNYYIGVLLNIGKFHYPTTHIWISNNQFSCTYSQNTFVVSYLKVKDATLPMSHALTLALDGHSISREKCHIKFIKGKKWKNHHILPSSLSWIATMWCKL